VLSADVSIPPTVAHLLKVEPVIQRVDLFGSEHGWKVPCAVIRYQRGVEVTLPASCDAVLCIFGQGALFERLDGPMKGRRGGGRSHSFALAGGQEDRSYVAVENSPVTQLYLQRGLFDDILAERGTVVTAADLIVDRIFADDPAIVTLVKDYAERARDMVNPPTRLEMDARAVVLAATIIRHFETTDPAEPVKRRTLGAVELDRVLDYIEDNLGADIGLEDLSAVVGVSVNYFAALFRQSMGTTPHQYLIARRIEFAKSLIDGGIPLAQTALDAGFSSQQHFSSTFHRVVGCTPRAWQTRAACRTTG
jgi:AraC-like DNA-binding protein